ncbi:MAG: PilZ domain-containing protein [Gammaproteobacteria bacterium]
MAKRPAKPADTDAARKPRAPKQASAAPVAAAGGKGRTSVRHRLRHHLRVLHGDNGRDFGRALDLSHRGLRIEHPKALREGTVLDLQVECRRDDEPWQSIRVAGKVRWCTEGAVPGRYELGLQIKAIVSRDAALLEALYDGLEAATRHTS